MSTPEAPGLRFAFRMVAEVGAYLPLEQRDRVLLDVLSAGVVRHFPGGAGQAEPMGYFQSIPPLRTTAPDFQWLTRSSFVGRAFANEHDTSIDVSEVLA